MPKTILAWLRLLPLLVGCQVEDECLQRMVGAFEGMVVLDQQTGSLGLLVLEVTVYERHCNPGVLLRVTNPTDEEIWWKPRDEVRGATRWGMRFAESGVSGGRGGGHGPSADSLAMWEDQLLWSMLPREERLVVCEWDLDWSHWDEIEGRPDPKREWTLNLFCVLPLSEPPKWRRESWTSSEIQIIVNQPEQNVAIRVDRHPWITEDSHE